MAKPYQADAFAALSDPTRRRIVELLAEGGAQRVADISAGFDMSRQAVTKHLNILNRAGVVVVERRGRERFNRLAGDAFEPIRDWLARYDRFWEARLGELKKIIEEGVSQ
jgi:DNA-binding transcriptional ArsR family regulator